MSAANSDNTVNMPDTVSTAILIPVFNNYRFTQKALQNLEHLKTSVRVIVIDDGSSDGTSENIAREFPWVTVIRGDGSLWWSGAINMGMEYAFEQMNFSQVIWWNNDIICRDDYMLNAVKFINKHGSNTVIGSKIFFYGKQNIIWGMGGYFNPVNGGKDLIGLNQPDGEIYEKVVEADWLPGMGTIISREVFRNTGYLNARDFPQYHGDSDYTLRIKKAGFRIIVEPELCLWNDKTNSGLMHNGSWKKLIESLTSIRSNYNLRKDFRFYFLHSDSPLAYTALARKYLLYTGGFVKWKVLGALGMKKPIENSAI